MAQISSITPSGGAAPLRTRRSGSINRKLLKAIGTQAMRYVRPKIPSTSLRKALNLFVFSEVRAFVQIPHYWAIYVHDGRGPFSMPAGRVMCWFRDPKNDPRLREGHSPVRAADIRRLTKEEFRFWVQKNREAVKAGTEPPMIITRRIRRGTRPTPFFDNGLGGGMAGFLDSVSPMAAKMVQDEIKDQLGDLLLVKDTAKVSF